MSLNYASMENSTFINRLNKLEEKFDKLYETSQKQNVCNNAFYDETKIINDKITKLKLEIEIEIKRIKNIEEKISEKYAHPDVIGRIECLENRYRFLNDNLGTTIENLLKPNIECVHDRLDKLEGYMTMEDRVSASDVLLRLSKIENDLDSMDGLKEIWKAINELRHAKPYSKHPHKCPVCDGLGKATALAFHALAFHDGQCKPCEGKGIVWG